jgi:hypothetical protein
MLRRRDISTSFFLPPLTFTYLSPMENWAIDQLGMFLGFDPETLKTQVMPYLLSFDSPTALSEHLQVITLED